MLTFLAVFLIQNSQNRDGAAIQAKLDEILRSATGTRSGFIGIENLTDQEIVKIKQALEREVLQVSEGEPDGTPTVEELLNMHNHDEGARGHTGKGSRAKDPK